MQTAARLSLRPSTAYQQPPASSSSSASTSSSSSSSACQPAPCTIPVHVYCRLRPLVVVRRQQPDANWLQVRSATTIAVHVPPTLQPATRGAPGVRQCEYSFRRVFDAEAAQRDVFDAVAKPLVDNLLGGRNSLLLTYGITGSGKTYTMTGNAEQPGVVQLALDALFAAIEGQQVRRGVLKVDGMNGFDCVAQYDGLEGRAFGVFVNYVEFYNNSVYDLLEEPGGGGGAGWLQKPLQSRLIREDGLRNQMYVHGVTEVAVRSYEEALEVFQCGQKRKRVAHTLLNTASSRSHSSFNIRLVRLLLPPDGGMAERGAGKGAVSIVVSQLSLVDLAGSERTSRTKNCGLRLREASSINNSLLTLRTCLEYLRESQQAGAPLKKIPYRDAKLTHMFRHFFEGAGQVCMIVCLNAQQADLAESLHVLKFAEMTKELQIARAAVVQPSVTQAAETPAREQADQATETEALLKPLNVSGVFGVDFPPYEQLLSNPDTDADTDVDLVFLQLRRHLEERVACRRTLRDQLDCHFDVVQQQLMQAQQESGDLRQMLTKTSEALQQKHAQNAKLSEQVVAVEARNAKLMQNLLKRESQVEALQLQVSAKDELLQHRRQNESYLRESMRYRVACAKEQSTCAFDDELRRRTEDYEAQLRIKDEKLRLVSTIVQSEDMPSLRRSMSLQQQLPFGEQRVRRENVSADANTQTPSSLSTKSRRSTISDDATLIDAKAFFKENFPPI